MSDSSNYSNMSDLDDIADIDLVMQLNKEDQQMQGESSGRSRKAINRERDMAEARLMADYFDFFTMCIIDLFTTEFLRKPDVNDIRKLYDAHNRIHGLPGMLGSIDCMHWELINCPKAWHGQFEKGDKKYPTIMLEAVASYNLWIWHAFYEVAGANNDLTVLNHSPLSVDLLDDIAPVVPYDVNGVTFKKGYYLADGIYPQWAAFFKLFTVARDERNAVFRRRQESARKDVEKAFGVL
nr:hypothetical protein [Tanacetum cinerariifolium]